MSCNTKTIDIQGHRGCRGLLPENSLPAFKKAIDIGVHTLEMDIAVTKDYKIVVSHEPFMSRRICLKPNGETISEVEDMQFNLYSMTHEEIQQFDCGTKFHPDYPNQEKVKCYKPLLSEVFLLAESLNPNIKYNIEIKAKPNYDNLYTPNPETFVKLVLGEIENFGVFNKTNLQSFDLRILEEIKKQSPKMKVALLVNDNETIKQKRAKLSYKPDIISPYYKLLDLEKVKHLQAEGFEVIPWTVNTTEEMKNMINLNVDGIITDYPDKLVKLLN